MYMTVAQFRKKVSALGLRIKERNFRYADKKAYQLSTADGEPIASDTMMGLRDQAMNGAFLKFGL